ncbi:MAG: hypothetical protein LUD12_17560 [Lachnospiraceae bacterium]|nr:hypothetical protein [Lachnospiraceae bacterium]
MGTFANSFYARGAHIPEEKEQEFRERVEKLYQAGGMMDVDRISMFGIEVFTLRKAQMHEYGMNFYYNYFEEDSWENAGFYLEENRVWSRKIGWLEFNIAVVSAYVLEHLYREGTGGVFVNGELVEEEAYIGWINYLFNEKFCEKNRDPWKLFDAIETETDPDEYLRDTDYYRPRSVAGIEWMVGYTEIYAVRNGIDAMLHLYDGLQKGAAGSVRGSGAESFFSITARDIVNAVRSYRVGSDQPMDEQLQTLCNHFRTFYRKPELTIPDFVETYGINRAEIGLYKGLIRMNLPVIAVKAISEEYEKDFWELWEELSDAVYGTRRVFPALYESPAAEPVSTAEFFGRSADDMIYFWREGGDIVFSDKLVRWFSALKKRFDEIMDESFEVENPVRWILELMNYAQEEYYHIFAFTEFYEESMAHLSEKKYIALWKLYDELLHDPIMEEAGKVIFVPDGPGHEKEGLHYLSAKQPRRRLLRDWCITDRKERENAARVTLRRYMALAANVELRKKVFGF